MEQRTMSTSRTNWALAVAIAACTVAFAQIDTTVKAAATTTATEESSPLGTRQQQVLRLVQDFEVKLQSLAQTLQKEDPERAERLIKAFQKSKELLLRKRMEEVADLLDSDDFATASGHEEQIIQDLEKLIKILTAEDVDYDKKAEEMDRLEKWRKEINDLLDKERQLRRESDRFANKDRALADLARQIAALRDLIQRQTELIRETAESRQNGIEGLGQLADRQRDIRLQTSDLADEVAGRPNSSDSADGGKSSGGSEGGQPSDSGSGSESSGSESGSEGGGEPETEGGSQSSGGSPSSEGGSQGGSQGGSRSSPLDRAADHQKKAEEGLEKGAGKTAERDQERALAEMKKALEKLEADQQRIAKLPPEAFDDLADKQDDLRSQTAKVGGEMQNPSGNSQSGGGSQSGGESQSGGGSQSGGQQPPTEQMKNAQQSMRQASEDLRNQQAGDAGADQDAAIEELKKALKRIEERLAQLRDELAVEKLARLEARFREMLVRQQRVTIATAEKEAARVAAGGRLPRSERLAIPKLAEEERELARLAELANGIIINDGTSVVFPEVVRHLEEDFRSAASLLVTLRTDAYTRSIQQEIELTLEELIDALKKAQQQKKQSGGGGGGGGGQQDQPLLPSSAELKLLRSSQLRVNRRTTALNEARGENELDDAMRDEVRKIAEMQLDVARITEKIVEQY
jgi:hypothetical protein